VLLLIKHQRPNIPGTVHHAHDDDFRICDTVVQHVITVEVRPQPFSQIAPAWTNIRLGQKNGKAFFNLPDKLRGGPAVVLCDETPDIY
jgi:hypothetical protein